MLFHVLAGQSAKMIIKSVMCTTPVEAEAICTRYREQGYVAAWERITVKSWTVAPTKRENWGPYDAYIYASHFVTHSEEWMVNLGKGGESEEMHPYCDGWTLDGFPYYLGWSRHNTYAKAQESITKNIRQLTDIGTTVHVIA